MLHDINLDLWPTERFRPEKAPYRPQIVKYLIARSRAHQSRPPFKQGKICPLSERTRTDNNFHYDGESRISTPEPRSEKARHNAALAFLIGYPLLHIGYLRGGNEMQVSKWGNSLAVRIPAHIVRQLGLQEGDNVEAVFARLTSRSEALSHLADISQNVPKDLRIERLDG